MQTYPLTSAINIKSCTSRKQHYYYYVAAKHCYNQTFLSYSVQTEQKKIESTVAVKVNSTQSQYLMWHLLI